MILQVLADPRLVSHQGNAQCLQLGTRTDAGELEQLDRADGAGRQDDLAAAARRADNAVLAPAHAGSPRAVEQHRFDEAVGLEPQVLSAEHGLEKTARRRPAPASLLVDVKGAA